MANNIEIGGINRGSVTNISVQSDRAIFEFVILVQMLQCCLGTFGNFRIAGPRKM